jgi:hypothetical protein
MGFEIFFGEARNVVGPADATKWLQFPAGKIGRLQTSARK